MSTFSLNWPCTACCWCCIWRKVLYSQWLHKLFAAWGWCAPISQREFAPHRGSSRGEVGRCERLEDAFNCRDLTHCRGKLVQLQIRAIRLGSLGWHPIKILMDWKWHPLLIFTSACFGKQLIMCNVFENSGWHQHLAWEKYTIDLCR